MVEVQWRILERTRDYIDVEFWRVDQGRCLTDRMVNLTESTIRNLIANALKLDPKRLKLTQVQ